MLQDPGTSPARRIWTSLDVGTEIFVSDKDEVAEWTLSDFDVILTSQAHKFSTFFFSFSSLLLTLIMQEKKELC